MMSSTKCRPRALLIGCAWFAAASTIITVLLCVRYIDDDGSTFYTNNFAVYKRKPQSREYDYNSNSDDVSESDYHNDRSQQQQQQEHDKDVSVTSSSIKSIVGDHLRFGSDVIEDKIFWSQEAESLVPIGMCVYMVYLWEKAGLNNIIVEQGCVHRLL